jgi:hypothetical protein
VSAVLNSNFLWSERRRFVFTIYFLLSNLLDKFRKFSIRKVMNRRELLKYLTVIPVTGAVAGAILPYQSAIAEEPAVYEPGFQGRSKRLAAIITEYRPNSHADVIIGK